MKLATMDWVFIIGIIVLCVFAVAVIVTFALSYTPPNPAERYTCVNNLSSKHTDTRMIPQMHYIGKMTYITYLYIPETDYECDKLYPNGTVVVWKP